MPKFQVVLHVEEDSIEDAKIWLDKAKVILTENRQFLISSTGRGAWCEGHIFPPDKVDPADSKVLHMAPRT